MAEEEIFFQSGEYRIEGLWANQPGDKALVMTHPHSLYGGEMRNHVVSAVVRVYQEKGYSTLRFNFRGVGRSEGNYDEGKAEQADVLAALQFVQKEGKKDIDLGGYSFGAWVNAKGLERYKEVRRVIMVSPPASVMDFDFMKNDPRIRLIIGGSSDEIGDVRVLERLVPLWNKEALFKAIEGADHFYSGKTNELKDIIHAFLDKT